MPNLFDMIDKLFREQNHQMAWGRVAPEHVIGAGPQSAFKSNDDYVLVRLGSMFLRNNRELWLKLSPLVHATVALRGQREARSESAVIGPAQFGDLAVASADRSVVLNQRLAGPAVWRGGDLDIAAGLFAVPKDQAAAALLETLGQLSQLGVPGLKQALDIANIVRSGVEGLIGLNGTRPVLGVKVSLSDTASAGPCMLAGVAAPAGAVDFNRLWVREGRLYTGTSAQQLKPLEDYDHLLVAVERGLPRQDWRGLPSLTPHEAKFAAALRDTAASVADTRQRLNEAFLHFDVDLVAEEGLSEPDKARIRNEVAADLRLRLQRREDPLSAAAATKQETRSIGGVASPRVASVDFDFLDVGDLAHGTAITVAAGSALF